MGNVKFQVINPRAKAPVGSWRKARIVRLVENCHILTIDLTLPFGAELNEEIVYSWTHDHLPSFETKGLDLLRWHVLARRNAPEGTRYRLLLVAAPSAQILENPDPADILLPAEFFELAQAESYANQSHDQFIWSTVIGNDLHTLVYRQGQLADWFHEPMPANKDELWISERKNRILHFLSSDLFAEVEEKWTWVDASTHTPNPDALPSLCTWSWIQQLNIQPTILRERMLNRRGIYALTQGTVAFLLGIGLIYSALGLGLRHQRQQYEAMVQQSGSLLTLRTTEQTLQDSLQSEVFALEKIGVAAQSSLNLGATLQDFYKALPKNSYVDQLHLTTQAPYGMQWNLQVTTPDWDGAELFWKNFQALPNLRKVRLDGRKPNGDGKIQMRVEAIR